MRERIQSLVTAYLLTICAHLASSMLQVQIKLVSQQPTQLKVKLMAFALAADQLVSMESWKPCIQDSGQSISNGEIEKMLQCSSHTASDNVHAAPAYTGCHYLTFNGKQQASSNMHKYSVHKASRFSTCLWCMRTYARHLVAAAMLVGVAILVMSCTVWISAGSSCTACDSAALNVVFVKLLTMTLSLHLWFPYLTVMFCLQTCVLLHHQGCSQDGW